MVVFATAADAVGRVGDGDASTPSTGQTCSQQKTSLEYGWVYFSHLCLVLNFTNASFSVILI